MSLLDESITVGQSGHLAHHDQVHKKLNDLVFDVMNDYGAVGDGSTDDYAAINAALDDIRDLDADATTSKGAVLFLPHGDYRISQTLRVNRGLTIAGVGGGQFGGTVLVPDAGVTAIQADAPATSTDGFRGGGLICDLQIRPASKSGTGHGIFLKARMTLRNLYIRGCSGDGVHIVAASSDTPSTNANCWRMFEVVSSFNDGHGIFVDGGDTNAGACFGGSATDNGGWGVYDSSSLGSHWFGFHTSNNTLGGFKMDGTSADSVFVGCYTEGDQPESSLSAGAIWIGGTVGANFDTEDGAVMRGGVTGITWKTGVATDRMHSVGTHAASQEYWRMLANGTMDWGSGSAAIDTRLERKAADVLGVGAGDCFRTGVNTTANRPSASAVGNGSQFYDDTLNKPIWSDGTNWRDAAGTVV